jgi:hypothetical protein
MPFFGNSLGNLLAEVTWYGAFKTTTISNATMLIGTILLIYVVESTAASASSFVAPTRRRPSCLSSFHYWRGMVDSSSMTHSKRSNSNWYISSSWHDDYKQRIRIRRSQCTIVLNLAFKDDNNGVDVNDDDDAKLDRTNDNKRATSSVLSQENYHQ